MQQDIDFLYKVLIEKTKTETRSKTKTSTTKTTDKGNDYHKDRQTDKTKTTFIKSQLDSSR